MGRSVPSHRSPKGPEDREWNWHGTAESDKANAIIDQGGWEALMNAHAWYDPDEDREHDPPQEKQAYKLPHHELLDGRLKVVWHGTRAAMQVLAGARGGVQIPDADVKGVYQHLAEHYEEFGKEPPPYEEIGS